MTNPKVASEKAKGICPWEAGDDTKLNLKPESHGHDALREKQIFL